MSNLKIDIIYYKTSSDFELEFNLSGCCRMRIFKDKVDTQKGLINTLARDVARSKIIIVVTDLFGEESGIPALSKSIGLPLIVPNKEEYGIKTSDTIYIPDTAVPLVTKTGIYGGCIIESGPQSIIIVSSVRSLRHEIMKTYVHNYIFDIGQLMAYQERMNGGNHNATPTMFSNTPPVVNEIILPTNEPAVIPEDINNDIELPEVAENIEESPIINNPIVPFDEESEVVEETDSEPKPALSDLESAIEQEINKARENNKPKSRNIIHPGISAVDQLEFDQSEEKELYKKSKKKHKASNVLLLIIIILLLIGFGVLAYFLVYLPLTGSENVFGDGNFLSNLFNKLFS